MVFHALNRKHILKIVDLMLAQVTEQVKEKNIYLEVTPAAREFLAEKGFDPDFGARPLRRAIQSKVEDPLSESLLANKFAPWETVVVDVEKGRDRRPHQGGGCSHVACNRTQRAQRRDVLSRDAPLIYRGRDIPIPIGSWFLPSRALIQWARPEQGLVVARTERHGYLCGQCGQSPPLDGFCSTCGSKEPLLEAPEPHSGAGAWLGSGGDEPQELSQISLDAVPRIQLSYPELNRVLGGGVVLDPSSSWPVSRASASRPFCFR